MVRTATEVTNLVVRIRCRCGVAIPRHAQRICGARTTSQQTGWGPRTTALWMEALAVVAFGASWLTKGFDYKYLFQHK